MQCTMAENEDRSYADRIAKAVNDISSIAANLADSADRGATINFTDARLQMAEKEIKGKFDSICLLYTSPSPRDGLLSRMPSSA